MKMISRKDLKQRVMEHFCGGCSMPYKDTDILELGEYCCDMVSDTIAFIDELPTIEAEPVNGWISVKDRLPKTKMDHVLFTLYTPAWHDITDELPEDERDFPEEYVTVCGWFDVHDNGAKRYWSWISSDGYQSTIRNEYVKADTGMITYITHWRYLPEPPKGE